MKKKFIKYFGTILTIVSLIFIIRLVINFDINFRFLLSVDVFLIIFGLAILLSACVAINSIAWKMLIQMLSKSKLKAIEVIHVYARSNMGKYLPGNIMQYASRNIIGNKYSIKQSNMFFATALEIILKILSAFLIVIVFVRDELIYVINKLGDKIYVDLHILLIMIGLMVISIIVLLYIKSRKMVDKNIRVKPLLGSFAMYTFIFFINVLVFLIVSIAIVDGSIANKNLLYISGVYIIAWLLGYLTPGAPGGIGIRESIMILMLESIYGIEKIVLVSVIIRLITILSDIIAFVVDILLEKRRGIVNETYNSNTMLQ